MFVFILLNETTKSNRLKNLFHHKIKRRESCIFYLNKVIFIFSLRLSFILNETNLRHLASQNCKIK
jgi:hypothetical protein